MPPTFNFPYGEVKMWVPMREDVALEPRDRHMILPVGRLNAGWPRDKAREELEGIQRDLAATYPKADGQFAGVTAIPLREALNFAYDVLVIGFSLLLGAVGLVLLMACVNVASLTLARMSARSREVAVRVAIGAGRGRLVRQLLTESLLLALIGGSLGTLLAFCAAPVVGPIIPEAIFRVGDVAIDGTVLAFTILVTLLTPLAFGLAPALVAARTSLADALKEGGRGGPAGSMRGRRALVVAEITMAIVLITGTGLMLRSFLEIQNVDIGFRAPRLLTVIANPPESDYPDQADIQAYFDRAQAELGALPGVRSVGTVQPLPMDHASYGVQFARPGQAPAAAEDWPVALHGRASPGYFETMGIPVLAGRAFTGGDDADAPDVVIVSQKTADNHWRGESPVGSTILIGEPDDAIEAAVVGVVGNVKHTGFGDDMGAQLYRPMKQGMNRGRYIVVATERAPSSVAGSVRGALRNMDVNLPLVIRPMMEMVQENTLQWSISSAGLGIFGLVALLLASVGIYGVVSFSVAQRRREIGIRMALGATSGQVRGVVVGEGLRLTAVGVAIGLVLALVVGQLMASMLFRVSPFDPVTLGSVLVLFGAVATVASLLPARRAARVDPTTVLRYE